MQSSFSSFTFTLPADMRNHGALAEKLLLLYFFLDVA